MYSLNYTIIGCMVQWRVYYLIEQNQTKTGFCLFHIFAFACGKRDYTNQENFCFFVYSEASQTSKMELLARIFTSFKSLSIFAKSSILDAWLGSERASNFALRSIRVSFEKCQCIISNIFWKIISLEEDCSATLALKYWNILK